MTTAPADAAQEYALELTESGVSPEIALAAALGYTRGWQDREKEET